MTKIYDGSGQYTVHLNSGKTLILTEDEFNDFAESAGIVEELTYERDGEKEASDALDKINNALNDFKESKLQLIDNVETRIWVGEEIEGLQKLYEGMI